MAQKEVTIFIIDVAQSMGELHNDRQVSDLKFGMRYVNELLLDKVLIGRKSDHVGVLSTHSYSTVHHMDDENLTNVCTHLTIQQPLLKHIDALNRSIEVNQEATSDNPNEGSIEYGLTVGINMIEIYTKNKKYIKNIILVTNGDANEEWNAERWIECREKMIQLEINFTLIGIDFENLPDLLEGKEDFETKDSMIKLSNEQGWVQFFRDIQNEEEKIENLGLKQRFDLIAYSNDYAEKFLQAPRQLKVVKPTRSFQGELTIGGNIDNVIDDKQFVKINIEMFPATKVATSLSSTATYKLKKDNDSEIKGENQLSIAQNDFTENTKLGKAGLFTVKNFPEYRVYNNELDEDSDKYDIISEDNLVKSYRFGFNVVNVVDPEVEKLLNYESFKKLEILGFIDREFYYKKPWLLNSESYFVIPDRKDLTSSFQLASLVEAMASEEKYAIARYVKKDGSEVEIVQLSPLMETNLTGLMLCRLPFKEDEKVTGFAPLNKVFNTAGVDISRDENGKLHRLLPDDDSIEIMKDYIDSLSLDDDDDETDFSNHFDTYPLFKTSVLGKDEHVRFITNYGIEKGVVPNSPKSTLSHKGMYNPMVSRLNQVLKSVVLQSIDDKGIQKRDKIDEIETTSESEDEGALVIQYVLKHPETDIIPSLNEMVMKYSRPPSSIIRKANVQNDLRKLIGKLNIEKIEKVKRKRNKEISLDENAKNVAIANNVIDLGTFLGGDDNLAKKKRTD